MKYLLLLCLFACSCVNTSYKEYASNGQLKYDFKTYGDFGVSTSAKMGDSSRTGILPLLGGSGNNDYDITQKESEQPSSITIGDNFKIEGTLVHSTGMGVVAKGIVRGIREVAKGVIYGMGINALKSVENAKTNADVAKSKSGDGVEINQSNNDLKGLENTNATEVQKLEIEAEAGAP